MNNTEAFKAAIAAAGLTPPDEIVAGKLTRFSTNGKRSDDAGWYIFHDDERAAGRFGCNRSGVDATWRAEQRREFTPEERRAWAERMRALEAEREAERQAATARAADKAASMWAAAREAGDAHHDYLQRKRIPGIGARLLRDQLLVPMRQGPGALCGLQVIQPDGGRKFLTGTPAGGAYTTLGRPSRTGPLVICEGYATGVSIHLATGWCVVVAFNSGNLAPVAQKIRAALPEAQVIIGADEDEGSLEKRIATQVELGAIFVRWTTVAGGFKAAEMVKAGARLIVGNPGIEAAAATGLPVAIPRWAGDRGRGTDFNDLHVAEGLDAVRACFDDPQPIEPPRSQGSDKPDSVGGPGGPNNTGSSGTGSPTPWDGPAAVVEPPPALEGAATPEPAARSDVIGAPDDPGPVSTRRSRARPLIFNSMPMTTAEMFHETLPEGGRILFWRGEFYSWDVCRYVVRDPVWIEQRLYYFMAGCDTWKVNPKDLTHEVVPYHPKAANVRDVAHALRAVCFTPAPDAGTWLDPREGDPPGHEIIAFQNCFLHWPTRTMMPPTDRLLITTALEFDYQPEAQAPAEWLRFLGGLWPSDPESVQTLGEMFGYMLTDDTSQQKIFMLIGPPRCGKGTILRVLESLVGKSNRCSPSLSSLGGPFGLQSLLGKRLAMISDARLSGKADQHAIVENLLRISGEDAVDVARKNLPSIDGVLLRTRFVMATNELPAFTDASSALPNRFIPFRFTQSFLGQEDHGLTARLLRELSGILIWALDGLNRLRQRGYFVTPASAEEIREEFMEQASPIKAFVRDVCTLGDGNICDRDELFDAWRKWCTDQGREHAGTKVSFGRQLSAAFPQIRRLQRRDAGTRSNEYQGVRLTHEWERNDGPY